MGLLVVRWVVRLALLKDGVAMLEIAGLDVAALLVLVPSFALGPMWW
ncbi:hypothetical protein [Sorangium sp. So ce1000]